MALRDYPDRYHPASVFLHWATALLCFTALTLALIIKSASGIHFKLLLTNLHFVFGSCVLFFVLLRIALRAGVRPPPSPPSTHHFLQKATHVGHFLLYFFLTIVPVLGLVTAFLLGRELDFGIFSITSPMIANKEQAKILGEIHGLLAWTFLTMVSGHVLAALWHHHILKDQLMNRMKLK